MLGLRCLVCLGVVLGATGAMADDFQLVPAALSKPRGGLGNVFAKLQAGGEVRIAYFGGSITAANGWRPKTLKWLQERYPNAKVSEINAAIGGTGSDLGVYRCRQDVLSNKPDLVFVEFAVNDGGAEPHNIWRSMEGIVRQTWEQDPTIDICYVYTIVAGFNDNLTAGLCPRAASADEVLADHYGIPSINVALKIAQMHAEGKLQYQPIKDQPVPPGVMHFSDDGVHPHDAGHGVYRDVIGDALAAMEPNSKPGPHELKPPLQPDNWEQAKLVPLAPEMLSPGWEKLPATGGLGQAFAHFMPEMWHSGTPGSTLTFKFKGSAVKLYDLLGPNGGQVMVTIDGQTRGPVARFDSYCTYHRLATLQIADGLPDQVHTVKVEIHPDQPDRHSVAFRLKDPEKELAEPKFQGTDVWVGSIMMIGELVKD